MVEFLGYTLEDLYNEAVELARAQGVTTREGGSDMVEQVIEDRREFQEVHDDDDADEMREALQNRWPDYAATLSSEKPF